MAADRRIAVDPNAPPWNAVARVQTNTGVVCSGVLIAPAVVLTAAHCLYNRLTGAMLRPLSLHVLFGYERDRYRRHRRVARFAVGPGFDGRARRAQASDWARLDLAAPVAASPLPLFAGRIAAGLPAMLAGYNQDRTQLLLADPACSIVRALPAPGGGLFLVHDCQATHGTSGAPLLARERGGWAVAGINLAAGRADNLALAPPPAAEAQAAKP